MKYTVIERATGKVDAVFDEKNVKGAPTVESLEAMRAHKDHHLISFLIELKNYKFDWAMYEVDKYDLVIA